MEPAWDPDGMPSTWHCLGCSRTLPHRDGDPQFGGGTTHLKWPDIERSVTRKERRVRAPSCHQGPHRAPARAVPMLTQTRPNPRRSEVDTDGQLGPANPGGLGWSVDLSSPGLWCQVWELQWVRQPQS